MLTQVTSHSLPAALSLAWTTVEPCKGETTQCEAGRPLHIGM